MVRVYFLEPRNSLKMWTPCYFWGPNAAWGSPGEVNFGTDCFSRSPRIVAYVGPTCKRCANCNIAVRNRSSNGTADSVHVWGPCNVRFGLILLVYGPRNANGTDAGAAFRLTYQTLVWLRGTLVRTLVFVRRTFPVPRWTCSWRVTTYVGKPPAIGQPTRPTRPFIL